MIPTTLLKQARLHGVTLWAEGPVLRYRGPGEAITQLLPELKAHKADLIDLLTHRTIDLDTVLIDACQGVDGIDAATFRVLLSPVDVEDIEGGHIPVVTLNAYARSFAESIRTGRITVLAPAIPKPAITERVRCNGCRHFERDTIGDGTGIGSCAVNGAGTGRGQPCLWPNVQRACGNFEDHL